MIPAEPTEDELTDFIDGRLSDERRAEIEAWLRAHPKKALEVERQRQLNEALRTLGADILREQIPDRLRDVLRARAQSHLVTPAAGEDEPQRAVQPADERQSAPEIEERRQDTGERKPDPRRRPRLLQSVAAALLFLTGFMAGWLAHLASEKASSEPDRLLADASYAFTFYRDDRDHAIQFPPERLGDFEQVSLRPFERRVSPPDLTPVGYLAGRMMSFNADLS